MAHTENWLRRLKRDDLIRLALDYQHKYGIILDKISKELAELRKSYSKLESDLTIYKSFICPHFDYVHVIYDQSYNDSFHAKLELCQYNAALAMTGAIKRSSPEKLYQEFGIEHFCLRRWFTNIFYKVIKNKSPPYLFNLIPSSCRMHTTRNSDNITP